jgi:hypothetical protein
MNKFTKQILNIGLFGLVALALVFGMAASPSRAADHLDSPFTKHDGRTDINDVYLFHPSHDGSQDKSRTVLAMTVNPAAGVISGTDFRPDAIYQFVIDRNGDAVGDAAISVVFTTSRPNGHQGYTVTMQENDHVGFNHVLARGVTERVVHSKTADVTAFAGLRDDPFFFDLNSFNQGATFCEEGDSDFFLGLDTSAIVLELPTSMVGEGNVGVYGRTGDLATGLIDRMGRPAILTVFIPPNPFEPSPPNPMLEDAFNWSAPASDQVLYRSAITDTLTLLFSLNDASGDDPSDDAAKIAGLADFLLPDLLTADLGADTGFPNGRNLADDVIDAELGLITEGAITTDCIDNDSTFLNEFPYLGKPNHPENAASAGADFMDYMIWLPTVLGRQ